MHSTNFGGTASDARPWYTGELLFAECGSNQLEMRYLSHLSRNRTFADASNRFTNFLLSNVKHGWPHNESLYKKDAPKMQHKGLWGTFIDPNSGKFSGAAGFHSLMDSTYEYFLKQWILFGKDDPEILELYEDAVEGFLMHLLRYMPGTNYAVIGYQGVGYFPVMDHLVCFTPGMLILATTTS
jgi:mannosyl-oligosaccharide alpha-1,2-mannosidase